MTLEVPGYEFKVFQPKKKIFSEANAYYRLIEDAYIALHKHYEVFKDHGRLDSVQDLLDTVDDGWLIGLYKDDELVGTVTIHEDLEEEKKKPNTAIFMLHLVSVSTKYNGLGLGKMLVRYACDFVPLISGTRAVLMKLDAIVEHNIVRFYEGLGFEEDRRELQPKGTWGSSIPFTISMMSRWIRQ